MVLEFDGVYKYFGEVRALDGITFSMERERRIVILGPNGAGKSTLIKVAAGILKPDRGRVELRARSVGYLPDQVPSLDRAHSIMDLIWQFETLLDFDFNMRYLEELGLGENPRKKYRDLSKGEKKKVLLAIIMSMEPELCLLDEPFVGIDVGTKKLLARWLGGKSYLITTHEIDFVPEDFDRIYVMEKGRFVDSTQKKPEEIIQYNRPQGERIYELGEYIWIKLI